MTWLSPWFAGAVAAVAIPALVILYFLKLRRRDLEISTTLLWKKSIQDLQANAPFQRLRRNILLLLQLLVLLGVIAALGQPLLRGQLVQGDRHIIMIDRSASMSAEDGDQQGRTRLVVAKEQAIALARSLREPGLLGTGLGGSGDEAMVIAFDTNADVLQTFTTDKAALVRSIESIQPTDAPTRVELAMQLAKAIAPKKVYVDPRTGQTATLEGLTGGLPATVQMWTDGRIPDAQRSKPGPEDVVVYHQVGQTATGNVAIVGLKAERNFDDPGRLSVFVSVQNTGTVARSVEAELLIDGVVAGIKQEQIPAATRPNAAADVAAPPESQADERLTPGVGGFVFSMERSDGFLAQLRLRAAGASSPDQRLDLLPLDDTGWVVVPPARRLTVALVGGSDDRLVRRPLEMLPLNRLDTLSRTEFQAQVDQAKFGQYDVVILDGWLPELTRPGLAVGAGLPPGRYLVLNAVPQMPPSAADAANPILQGLLDRGPTGEEAATMFIDWQRTHPVTRYLSLDRVFFRPWRSVEVPTGAAAVVLARTERGPGIIELSAGQTRAIVMPGDYASSNWPFSTSFPLFLAAATTYLGSDLGVAAGQSVQPGSTYSDQLPAGGTGVTVRTPDDQTVQLVPAGDGRVVYGPVRQAGVYRVSWTGPAAASDLKQDGVVSRRFAANLLDPAESDVAASQQLELANQQVAAAGTGSSVRDRPLWPWLTLAALVVVMIEWWIYNRKVHV